MKHRKHPRVTYRRAFLITMGLIFMGIPLCVIVQEMSHITTWPWWSYAIVVVMTCLGCHLMRIGLRGSRTSVESWVEASTKPSESLVVMIIAFPVYLLIRLFEDRQ